MKINKNVSSFREAPLLQKKVNTNGKSAIFKFTIVMRSKSTNRIYLSQTAFDRVHALTLYGVVKIIEFPLKTVL